MRLLDRYLLRELLVPLGYCLSGFLLLWITSDLINELSSFQENKLHVGDIALYYFYKSPEILVLILPVGLLLALLYTLTNHARYHEITAIRAAGISLWRLCLPYLGVGLLASVALFFMNEYWAPDSADRAEAIRKPSAAQAKGHVQKLGFTNARDNRKWEILSYDARTGQMLQPIVFSSQPDGSHLRLAADRAVRRRGVWTFYNATLSREPADAQALPELILQTNVLAMPTFTETPDQINSEIRISSSLNALSWRGTKKADVPISEILNYLHLHPRPTRTESCWLYTKLQGRLAAPLTCLVVVVIAIPFGAASGRRNVFVGVASSIVICFVFLVLQQVCLALGTGGYLPAWVAGWFPNLAFGITGLWMTARVR